jgi:hypothetical protein
MNKNKVLLMYFTVFMASLRAGPGHGFDRSDTESAGHWNAASHLATIRSLQVLRSELSRLQYTTDNMQLILDLIGKIESLADLEKYLEYHVAQSLKPEKQNPIRNLKQCWAGYVELSELDEDDLKEDLSGYQNKFERLVGFMNQELEGIKKTYSINEDDALREKFSTIQEMYIMHLKVYQKLEPLITEDSFSTYENLIKMPHRAVTKHSQWGQIVGYLYAIYTDLETIRTTNRRLLEIKQKGLQTKWETHTKRWFPNSGIGSNGRFMLNKSGQTAQNLDLEFTLFEWELDSLWQRIMELVDDKGTLKKQLRLWKNKVSEMRLKTPATATKKLYGREYQEAAKFDERVLIAQMQRAIDAINKAFSLTDHTLWPEILELMIYLTEANSFHNLELMSFIGYIDFPVMLKQMDEDLKKELRLLTGNWLTRLVQKEYHFTTDQVVRDMDRLISLQKSGYKLSSAFIIGIIRRVVNPKKFPDQSSDIFNFHDDDDGHICGDANEILGLKS